MVRTRAPLISVTEFSQHFDQFSAIDCRFSLADVTAGEAQYREGHIPGAHYLHLARDLSGPLAQHGGRHPLPDPAVFCARLAAIGIGRDTPVVAYDDSGMAYAARLWWMMRALGYTAVQVLDGGLQAWRQTGGALAAELPAPDPVPAHTATAYAACIDIEGVRAALARGAVLIDSREEKRYQGLEEPIDPVAGHIPGAVNYPWQGVTDGGRALDSAGQEARWSDLDEERELVVYCGSGVTACVNILSLTLAGRQARLYAGSWSDWCSWMPPATPRS